MNNAVRTKRHLRRLLHYQGVPCYEKRQTVDEALTDMGRWQERWQRQVCSRKEFKASMSNW